jgi:hypothetical protein
MNAERWRQIEDLYHRAQVLEGDQRDALLKAARAGDEDVCREVESLLVAGQLPISLLDRPCQSPCSNTRS